MQPAWHHRLLAYTSEICAGLGIAGALALLAMVVREEGIMVGQVGVLLWITLAVLPTAAIGWILGMIFLWQMLLGRLAAKAQGWPFKVGERVRILRGPKKDTVAEIYEVWSERGQVRLALDQESRERVKDVFCAVVVCRVTERRSSSDAG